jgi:hypothetical protein
LQGHKATNSWSPVPEKRRREILGCMWVYAYKFDKHGPLG